MTPSTIERTVKRLLVRCALCSPFAAVPNLALAQSVQGAEPEATEKVPSAIAGPKQPAESPPTKEQCVESHRLAQQAQNEGKLVSARELARTCTSLACPGLVISDCARWLNDLDQRIPSVVLEVRLDAQPNLTATILADGKPVTEWTRGESLRLDPGEHRFQFELPPYKPISQIVLLSEGMRYRVVQVEFKSDAHPAPLVAAEPVPPLASSRATMERPTPFGVYALLGAGAFGIASFTTFATIGRLKQNDLDRSCKPNCSDGDLQSMRTSYLIGDVSLGVGVAAILTAGAFYLSRPEKKLITTTVGVAPMPGGASTVATYRF